MQRDKNNIFSIAPGLPFLETLAATLIDGELVKGFDPVGNPLGLANATVFLPTRRAARSFSLKLLEIMRERTGKHAVLLPRIRTIGDIDEEEMLFGLDSDVPFDTGKPINREIRRIQLAKLARGWSEALNPSVRSLFEEEDIVLPSSAADAIHMAGSIAAFMDQVETEETDWSRIRDMDAGEHANWWQVTLTFLKIVMEGWPAHLAETGEINPSEFRTRIINYRITQLEDAAKKGPVIAAGSTGSIPATARLIAAIAALENGAVVLPGIDAGLPQDIFQKMSDGKEMDADNVYSTHPQFGLARLAGKLGVTPETTRQLHAKNLSPALRKREELINLSLLPPEKSSDWLSLRDAFSEQEILSTFDNVSIVEAPGERQEALAIALKMREVLETPKKTAALVTPDRKLARRVANELLRFNIEIDDSGGAPLAVTPAAIFFRHLLKSVFGDDDPLTLSAFLKNDFLLLGRSRSNARRLAELLELLLIRNAIPHPDLEIIAEAARQEVLLLDDAPHAPYLLKSMSEKTKAELLDFASDLQDALMDLRSVLHSGKIDLAETLQIAVNVCEKLSKGKDNAATVFSNPFGEELLDFLKTYINIDTGGFSISQRDISPVVETLLMEKRIRSVERSHPRLHVYGPLEARLQSVDTVILGSLNEGSWPQLGNNDPFLNRPMRAGLDLPLPERRIGLAAHDFQQLAGNREVVFTRSKRVDDAPSIASRWLQRLLTFLGEAPADAMLERGERLIFLSGEIDRHSAEKPDLSRPCPAPPVDLRPRKLSFTEIETWIRDPYAIYARHILGLNPLPALVRNTDAALKGTLYHDIVAGFVEGWRGEINEGAYQYLSDLADEYFDELRLPPEVKSAWRPRFDVVAKDFLDWETARRGDLRESYCEVNARIEVDETGFVLKGRADRIDVFKDGSLAVLDYKTGTNPSGDQARTVSPQLALEGAVATKGGFSGVPSGALGELAFVRLQENNFKLNDISNKELSCDDIASAAWEKLKGLIEAYNDPDRGYPSRQAPVSETRHHGDYDHLARVREWSLGDDENEGAE